MKTVTYKKACKSCNTTTGVDHMIMWQDDTELYVDGNIISANELTKKILQWHYDTEFQCENCGVKNVWDIWDVAIGGQKLQSNDDPGIKMDLGDGRVIQYHFSDVAKIMNNAVNRLDLKLSEISPAFNYEDIAIKVTIMEAMTLMNTFFEIRLFPSKEVYDAAFDYFKRYFKVEYSQDELNEIKTCLSSWEYDILEDSYEGYYNFLDFEPNEILPKIYPDLPAQYLSDRTYLHFRKQYFQTKQFLTHFLIELSKEMDLSADQHSLNFMNKLLPSINKL